jgi:hypothetical protein
MIRLGVEALLAGFDPFIPGLDGLLWFVLRDGEQIDERLVKQYSLNWLRVCDAVLLTTGWSRSPGAQAEKKHAERLGIPVFMSLEDLVKEANNDEPKYICD